MRLINLSFLHARTPGHGDLYTALYNSGLIDALIAEGKEYIFVSNVDNLGATVDTKILQHMLDTEAEFLMEVGRVILCVKTV